MKQQKTSSVSKQYVRMNQSRIVLRNLRKNKGAMVGLFIIAVLVFIAIFADVIFDYDQDVVKVINLRNCRSPAPPILSARTIWGATS